MSKIVITIPYFNLLFFFTFRTKTKKFFFLVMISQLSVEWNCSSPKHKDTFFKRFNEMFWLVQQVTTLMSLFLSIPIQPLSALSFEFVVKQLLWNLCCQCYCQKMNVSQQQWQLTLSSEDQRDTRLPLILKLLLSTRSDIRINWGI